MTQMMKLIEKTSTTLASEMQASTKAVADSNLALSESLANEVISKAVGQNNSWRSNYEYGSWLRQDY